MSIQDSSIGDAPFRMRMEHELNMMRTEEKTYPELEFQIPEGVEKIEIGYRYAKGPASVIDIGLRSPERIIGWSGGAREHFFVGEDKATPGYLAGPLVPGIWAVMLGAYRIPEQGCKVTVQITLTMQHQRWIKGDLHAHTVHSDGSYTLFQAMELAVEQGLEFLALTDHNTASQNRLSPAGGESLLLIPGVELTSYKGHANLLGRPDALEDFRVLTAEACAEQLQKAQDQGALVSLNHPFDDDCPWEFGFDVPFDAVEVWNGPWRGCNERAVAWWQERLAEGKKIVAVGGSDTHRDHPLVRHGRPTAHVYAYSESASAILAAIRRGAVVLSHDPNETFIDLRVGETCPGGEIDVAGRTAVKLEISVTRAQTDKLSLWSDRGLEREWRAGEGRPVDGKGNEDEEHGEYKEHVEQFTLEMPADRLFYRLEARRELSAAELSELKQIIPELSESTMTIMTCLTNPIYLSRRHEAAEK